MKDYDLDMVVDTLREVRHVLVTNDLLDDDLAVAISSCLELLGVDDAEEN